MTSTREAWIRLALRHFVAIAAVVALGSHAWIYSRADADQPVHSDGYSYYVYVPSVVVYGDPTLEALARNWYGGEYPDFTGINRWPSTGRFLNPHPIGTAVLMSPFIFAAHALTRWSNLPPDGFSLFYQHAARRSPDCSTVSPASRFSGACSRGTSRPASSSPR